jgi:two-component system alkaline phosphatase synthesis response regulator PhoP
MTQTRKRILVVDDEAHILQVLSLKLRNAGYEVLTARDGEEGFEVATQQRPDLIIADFQMPYMTGLELCRALSAQQSTSQMPVIILTARGYALDDEDLKIGNIKTVLNKPFSPRGILLEVTKIIGGDADAPGIVDESTTSEAA